MTDSPAPISKAAFTAEMARQRLFGPSRGWSLEPVGTWLLVEGRFIADPMTLTEQMMQRLDALGARIDRLRITCSTLHPQLVAEWILGPWARAVKYDIFYIVRHALPSRAAPP